MRYIIYLIIGMTLLAGVQAVSYMDITYTTAQTVTTTQTVQQDTCDNCVNGKYIVYGKIVGDCSYCEPLFVKPINYVVKLDRPTCHTRYRYINYDSCYHYSCDGAYKGCDSREYRGCIN